MRSHIAITIAAILLICCSAFGQSFVNWESPHVNPIDITPDGDRLLVVNTADNRLEVFTITGDTITAVGSISVGLDPVSVRVRTNDEAWVVNHISDSVSIVDLGAMSVIETITTGDEPTDVVFAGTPQRAFVSLSQLNQVSVYDPADLSTPPIVLDIEGEDPRALATDGENVYVAIFESGNSTTALNEEFFVSNPNFNPYPGDPNPPPNDGNQFSPPINPELPEPPPVSIIVKKSADGSWFDDNTGDWSSSVFWDLHDHDVAVIDVQSLAVSYITSAMNLNMHLDVSSNGLVAVVGTDAINHVRFEPNVNGIFVRVILATMTAGSTQADVVLDLNPHLSYETPTVPQETRDLSIGDPRAIKFNGAGDRLYVAGMGSNNVVALTPDGTRIGLAEVGQGATGIAVDDRRNRLYVVNKFDASISVVDTDKLLEIDRVPFYDPTPQVIRDGRPLLYSTHATSGLGQASCASCHIDGRMDQLAWDLGDPSGDMKSFNQTCISDGPCVDWHPMKGPMSTQTLLGLVGTEPLHWRGDREDLGAFNGAFESLLGDDEQLTDEEMMQFDAFVTTLTFAPNPFRNMDGSLNTQLPNGGNAAQGEVLFGGALGRDTTKGQGFSCIGCHALPTGTNSEILAPLQAGGITQNAKTAQLRSVYDKVGFVASAVQPSNKGFGLIHDGSFDTLDNFLNFFFNPTEQEALDLEAFLLSVSSDTHPAVGVQTTIGSNKPLDPDQAALIEQMINLASANVVGLVVKGVQDAIHRGYSYISGDQFQSDRAKETVTTDELLSGARLGSALTFTVVPAGSQVRIGIDRDEDGFFDRDELDAGSDPADPKSTPDNVCAADLNDDGIVGAADLLSLLVQWGTDPGGPPDFDGDGIVGASDLLVLLVNWGPCP